MDFLKTSRELKLLRPPDFTPETQVIEFRKDPLTGVACRLNRNRTQRPKQTAIDRPVIELLQKSANCPFCPENMDTATPHFHSDDGFQPYYEVRDCRLFPNLYPLALFHANIVLTKQHFLPVELLKQPMLEDALATACLFIHDLKQYKKALLYPLICWNHLPPSSASIVHPHIQILADPRPTKYQARLLETSKRYYKKTHHIYWEELVQEEKKRGERFVSENDSVTVIASFAPQGNREFHIIFKDAVSVADLDEKLCADFASAVIGILRFYHHSGVDSFNLTTFSAAIGEKAPFYKLNAKIIARPRVQALYRNDSGVLERFHYETDIEMEPEVLAKAAKDFFGTSNN